MELVIGGWIWRRYVECFAIWRRYVECYVIWRRYIECYAIWRRYMECYAISLICQTEKFILIRTQDIFNLIHCEPKYARKFKDFYFVFDVYPTLHIYIAVQLKCGDTREGKWRGNWRMEWVASTLHTTSEHGVSSITTADAHTSAASSRLNWRPHRFKWTSPFRRKTKYGFCACAFKFPTQSTQIGLHVFLLDRSNWHGRICSILAPWLLEGIVVKCLWPGSDSLL